MKLFKKAGQPAQLTRPEALACVPQKSPAVTAHLLENGALRLEYPLTIKPFFIQLAERWHKGQDRQPSKKIELDTLGAMVWGMVDGETTVAAIIRKFAANSGLSLHEAEISVTAFLRELGKRGLLLLR